jgi:hypothetical protein
MKLTTIALAGALALSSTLALAQSSGAGGTAGGPSGAGSSGAPSTGSSATGTSMANPPGSTVGRTSGSNTNVNPSGNTLQPSGSPSGSTLTPTGPGSGLSK